MRSQEFLVLLQRLRARALCEPFNISEDNRKIRCFYGHSGSPKNI